MHLSCLAESQPENKLFLLSAPENPARLGLFLSINGVSADRRPKRIRPSETGAEVGRRTCEKQDYSTAVPKPVLWYQAQYIAKNRALTWERV
jgi:hypothetical protein